MNPVAPFSTRGVGCGGHLRVLAVCLERRQQEHLAFVLSRTDEG